jgi:hypothetical protein
MPADVSFYYVPLEYFHSGQNPRDVAAICACPANQDKFVWLIEHLRFVFLSMHNKYGMFTANIDVAVVLKYYPYTPFRKTQAVLIGAQRVLCAARHGLHTRDLPQDDRHQRRIPLRCSSTTQRGWHLIEILF